MEHGRKVRWEFAMSIDMLFWTAKRRRSRDATRVAQRTGDGDSIIGP